MHATPGPTGNPSNTGMEKNMGASQVQSHKREEFSKLSNGPKTELTKTQMLSNVCVSNSVCHQKELSFSVPLRIRNVG